MQLAPEFLALKPQPGEYGWATSLVFISGQQNWASYSCFQIKVTSHLPVVMTKFSRIEFHLNRWFKMKVRHRKCQGMTRGYTNVNLKTLEMEGMPAALLPRQQWSNSFSSTIYWLCWRVAWGTVLGSQTSHIPALPAPPGGNLFPNSLVATHTGLPVEGMLMGPLHLQEWELGASLPREEHEYQIKWEARLPNPWEPCQFLKVTEIMSRCDALFLICWYMVDN